MKSGRALIIGALLICLTMVTLYVLETIKEENIMHQHIQQHVQNNK